MTKLSLLLFAFPSVNCYSQNNGRLKFDLFSTEDGLPEQTPYFVHQDSLVYIWADTAARRLAPSSQVPLLEHSRTNTGEKQLTNINVLADEFFNLSYHGLRAKDKNFNSELVTHFDDTLPKVKV